MLKHAEGSQAENATSNTKQRVTNSLRICSFPLLLLLPLLNTLNRLHNTPIRGCASVCVGFVGVCVCKRSGYVHVVGLEVWDVGSGCVVLPINKQGVTSAFGGLHALEEFSTKNACHWRKQTGMSFSQQTSLSVVEPGLPMISNSNFQ